MIQATPIQIFLADDDEDDSFLFSEALSQIPIPSALVVAGNGMDLMNKLSAGNQKPDLIFLDMNMPVKNGLECLAEIRETDKETPVIILSTSVADNLLQSAYKGGANLYIQKPTSFNGLVSLIGHCIDRKKELGNNESLERFLIRS